MKPEISLARSVIITDKDQPSYVKYGMLELAEYLEEITGQKVQIKCSADPSAEVEIVAGAKRVQQFAPDVWKEKAVELGAEGFLIRVVASGDRMRLIVSGATPQGTKYGLANLMKLIGVEGRSAFVPRALDIISKPFFSMRGMHLNGWAFNYPYTFRCWKEEDWKRYVDILAYQGVNLFYLWPFMEIMPVPLSTEDESYLQEVRRVVDYAQRQRGMEVWIMQSANRVALNNCGVRDPRTRPYWVLRVQGDFSAPGQADMDPSDPKQFAMIVKARAALYRIVNNADGYCTIDSDPGGWPKSPLSDFMKIFNTSRTILDQTNVHGKRTKLINWLWMGWGHGDWHSNQKAQELENSICATIHAMKQEVPEPWWLIAGCKQFLPACGNEEVLAKTVYLPYNTIEGEPSRPMTQHNFTCVRDHLDALARHSGTTGLMGNVQTPLLQFPHIYYVLASAWNYAERKRTPPDVLLDLAGELYPEQKELLANCWMALLSSGRKRIGELADQLERLVKEDGLGRLGILGRKLFPDHRQIARDLVLQLKVWAAFEALRQTAEQPTTTAACAQRVEAFLDAALTWDRQHGWSAYWHKLGAVWDLMPANDPGYPQLLSSLKKVLGDSSVDEAVVETFLAPVRCRLTHKHNAWIVANCAIEPLKTALLKTQ